MSFSRITGTVSCSLGFECINGFFKFLIFKFHDHSTTPDWFFGLDMGGPVLPAKPGSGRGRSSEIIVKS